MKAFPRKRTRRRGFTLIELMITLVVFGILVGLAAPAMSGWINRNRLTGAVNQLTGDISYARMLAVRSGQRVTLQLGATTYTITRADRTEPSKRVDLAREHPGLALGWETDALTFDSRGLLLNGATNQITVSRNGTSSVLSVSLTGRVTREAY